VAVPLPQLWRARARRTVVVPVLLVSTVLVVLLAFDPLFSWTGRTPVTSAVALLVALLLAGVAAVFWQGDREATRVRRALAAGISHDMRTPLAQIRMFTEMLLMERARSEEERTRWLETIERETHRLGEVMENLLLFVHGEEPDPYPARQPIDLGALVEDAAVGFASRAAARRMHIEADPPAGIVAVVDPQAMRQVVGNLIDNALRFGPAGQTVTVTLDAPGAGHAEITVMDQGPGIPVADRVRVWQPFVRLDESAASEGGSGLGLAVVRQVVEAHGGHVTIADAPGGGTRMRVTVPIASASRAGRSAAGPAAERLLPTRP
jgi:signal transduction histidine kinase